MGEWKVVNVPWRIFCYGVDYRSGTVKVGMQIEMQNGVRYLVGDINPMGGTCDECRDFSPDDIVVRYRVVVNETELNL